MQPSGDDGAVLDAEYHVESEGQLLALVLESWSGGAKGGSRPARNPEYNRALTTLLTRLAQLDAVLVDALVDSQRTAALGVPEADRRIIPGPVKLNQQPDLEALRRQMGTAQSKVGQATDATKPGNSTKRIRLRLQVPGYGPGAAAHLEAHLAVHPGAGSGRWPSATEVLHSLIGEEIRTITNQKPNMVIAVDGRTALVSTNQSPQGQPVEICDVQRGMDRLKADGMVHVTVEVLGHRSSFIGAVLATLPGVRTTANPATVTVGATAEVTSSDPEFAVLDSTASVKVRREQAVLRSMLAGGREQANCALCGDQYPLRFLVAAHIKKRSICTDDERRDLRHVAMLACTFGCDALYEDGWITVGPDGRIEVIPLDTAPGGRLRDHLQQLAREHCQAHSQASEPYFDWHRQTVFRGSACPNPQERVR